MSFESCERFLDEDSQHIADLKKILDQLTDAYFAQCKGPKKKEVWDKFYKRRGETIIRLFTRAKSQEDEIKSVRREYEARLLVMGKQLKAMGEQLKASQGKLQEFERKLNEFTQLGKVRDAELLKLQAELDRVRRVMENERVEAEVRRRFQELQLRESEDENDQVDRLEAALDEQVFDID